MTANDRQVGGTHYAGEYQHWDFAINVSMKYMEGNATKYITRWRKKNGLQDLQKALHYVEKMVESYPRSRDRITPMRMRHLELFLDTNKFEKRDAMIIALICGWASKTELERAGELIKELIDEVSPVVKEVPIKAEDPEFRQSGDEWRQDGK